MLGGLNREATRNLSRFRGDFMFRLTGGETRGWLPGGEGGAGNAVRARIRRPEVIGSCGNDVSYAAEHIDRSTGITETLKSSEKWLR